MRIHYGRNLRGSASAAAHAHLPAPHATALTLWMKGAHIKGRGSRTGMRASLNSSPCIPADTTQGIRNIRDGGTGLCANLIFIRISFHPAAVWVAEDVSGYARLGWILRK